MNKDSSKIISANKEHDNYNTDTSYVLIKNTIEEEKKSVYHMNYPSSNLKQGFRLLEEITKREKLFISSPYIKDRLFKKLSFKEILVNIKKLNKESSRRLKLKMHRRKSRREEK